MLRRFLTSPIALALIVCAATFAIYANTLRHEFVWDDRALVPDNPQVRALDWPTVQHLFTSHFWEFTGKAGGLYRPLVSLSYHVDYQLHGLDAGGYHLTNVILNALVSALVFAFVLVLFSSRLLALLTALLFAALPLHTENVAWISGRSDLMATLWMLASLTTYVLWRRHRRSVFLVFSLLSFCLGLLSKEIAIITPLIIALLETGPFLGAADAPTGGRPWRRLAPAALVYAGVAVLYLIVRRVVLSATILAFKPFAAGVAETIALGLSTLARYAYVLVFPFFLNAEREFPVPESFLDPWVLAGLVVLAAIVFAVWRWRHVPQILLGIGILVIGLLPVLNIVPLTETSAERFLYVPSLGFVLIVATLITAVHGRGRRMEAVAVVAAVAIVSAWGARTFVRNFDWRNESTLFSRTLQAEDESARAHLNLGNVYYRDGRNTEAIAEYRKALAIDPNYGGAWSSMAGAYVAMGQIDEAMTCMENALSIEPKNANFHNSLGILYIRQDRFAEARESFRRALTFYADHPEAMFNLALAAYMQGDHEEAKPLFERLPHKEISHPHAYLYLALIESQAGNRRRAVDYATKFMSIYTEDDGYRAQAKSIISGGR